ncbi:MAG: M20/M25/M40 family metallo-hydrolase [Candidatus Zixiibacteriota bacterium]|nr:MAG: M20/M25/M40 family metallo-hydrolase [candidate division Zixibacteria bacterium]
MTPGRKTALCSVLVIGLAAQIQADDIALLKLSSQNDVATARAVLGHAYGRIGERFLVAVDDESRNMLQSARLVVETILPSAGPEGLQVILTPPQLDRTAGVDISQLGRVVALEDGTRLVQMSRAAATAVSSESNLMIIPLQDRHIDFFYHRPSVSIPIPANLTYPTDTLALQVEQDSVYAVNKRLEDFYTRYIWTDSIDRARDWMVQKFQDWGYTDVTTPSFYYGGGWHYNVRAVKPGVAEPDKVIVVGAHYDAVVYNQPQPATEYAPGADDDASGVAVIMEMARILADVPLRKTVIFIPFSAEEVGLVGSDAAAADIQATGTDLEVMYNFDMVGFTGGEPWYVDVEAGVTDIYQIATVAAGNRASALMPLAAAPSGNSDHAPFRDRGYPISYVSENNFNILGWHTNLDITDRMDFPYLTEVVKMSLAALAHVAQAPSPAAVGPIVDIGDGQSLEIGWSPCYSDNSYTIYRGNAPGVYSDSVTAGVGACSYVWSGLTEGVMNYFLVVGTSPVGYPALQGTEGSEQALSIPRPPADPRVMADSAMITISWAENKEADFSYYNLYRGYVGVNDPQLFESNITDTSFVDNTIIPRVEHAYYVTAVDLDGFESEPSETVTGFPATFDGGIGIMDAFTTENQYHPTQEEQESWMDTLMSGRPYGVALVDEYGDAMTRSDAGPFSSILWLDDDLTLKEIENSEATLSWYADYNTNIVMAGFFTILSWSDHPISSSHMLYREFGISNYDYWGTPDFVGAHGQNGWPSVEIDPSRGLVEWPNIPVLTLRPGATVIYTYDSYIDYPDFEGKPVGVIYDGSNGKRVLLSFPIYYLTPASAQAFMTKCLDYLGESFNPSEGGDVNSDGIVDISDLTRLIDYLFISYIPLSDPAEGDVNNDCTIDIADLTLVIAYLFMSGPDLQRGCAP